MESAQATQPRKLRTYNTRLDRFRARYDIDLDSWAMHAHMSRTHFNKHRIGTDPRSDTLATLVRSASLILGRPVEASELYDLGEDATVAPVLQLPPDTTLAQLIRETGKDDSSPLALLLRRLRWGVQALSRRIGVSKMTLLAIRAGRQKPKVSTVRKIVIGLRSMGYDVKASDVVDIGEAVGQSC